jgi:SET and MYND domain-containing protein
MDQLQGSVEEFRAQKKNWAEFEFQATSALLFAKEEVTDKSIAQATEWLCKIKLNTFDMTDDDLGHSGSYLHATLAMVNHSCLPNATVQFIGRTAYLRALEAIEKGEEIRISYIGQ